MKNNPTPLHDLAYPKQVMELERLNMYLGNKCDELSDRVKELEAEINQRDNEIKTIRAISNGMLKENEKLKKEMVTFVGYSKYIKNQHLQTKLDEAVEIIKTISKNANHYDKIDLQNKAEQFLSILDKPKEEL